MMDQRKKWITVLKDNAERKSSILSTSEKLLETTLFVGFFLSRGLFHACSFSRGGDLL